MKTLLCVCAFATVAAASTANAQGWFDPPGFPFQHYTSNSNDGYSSNRGDFFSVSANLNANSYHWTNDMPAGVTLTWELRENGVIVHTTTSSTGAGGLLDYSAAGSGYLMTPGNTYDIAVQHTANGVRNFFYNWNGSPQFPVGVITVIDGHLGNNGSNTVAPRMGINVPGPAAVALLGIGGLVATRRRR